MSTASESPYVQGVHLQRTDENVREIGALAEVLGETLGALELVGLVVAVVGVALGTRRPAPTLVP